ncbi:retrograde regulation protein 2 [Cadophora sp. DSE1049]|nr:retrograde regulation protein 2 [Cadophora sp. DSE1049]
MVSVENEARKGRGPWQWFAPTDTKEERRLILKLDLLILPYAFLMFWVSYIDGTNISNAWVSGLSDDLGFHGNQLVHFQTMSTVGQIIGQIPSAIFFSILPMHWIVPGTQLGWGVFTLVQFRAQTYGQLMAYRFMIGFFEASLFPGIWYVLGSWYRPDEIGRRAGMFQMGLPFAALTAGLVQSGASANLDGVNGLAGWRWMFIIVSIMTFPTAFLGFFIWPGTPTMPNKIWIKEKDLAVHRKHFGAMAKNHVKGKHSWALWKGIFLDWKIWTFTIYNNLLYFSDPQPWSGYLLWLKSLGRYSDAKVNSLSATAPGVGMLLVLVINSFADWFGRPVAVLVAQGMNAISTLILIIWDVPEAAKWYAFNTYYADVGMNGVVFSYCQDACRRNDTERGIIVVVINIIAQIFRAWAGNLMFATVDAPRFQKGYGTCFAAAISIMGFTYYVRYLYARQE